MDASFFEIERLTALAGFALATTWTPGPNNILLASSAARFGLGRTIPHAMGVAIGFSFMIFLVARGLGELFVSSALFRESLRWAGAALLLYIAWRIATAPATVNGDASVRVDGAGRPFTFLEAAGFQWINPKAWAMAIGVGSTFLVGQAPTLEALAVAAVFMAVGLTSSHGWAIFGAAIRRLLSTERRARGFNIAMGVLVAACVAMLFLD